MNEDLVQGLKDIAEHYKTCGKYYQQKAFENAAKKIAAIKKRIISSEDLGGIYGIGKGIKLKVDEILNGRYVKYENTGIELLEIRGIGPKTAEKLVEKGLETIEDLRELPKDSKILTHSQKLGLEYFEDLKMPVKRAQIDKVKTYINEVVKTLKYNYTVDVVGSYRRKAPESGDIDILLINNDSGTPGDLRPIVKDLIIQGYIIGTFGISHRYFSGIFSLNSKRVCSIDIKLYPKESYAFALMYFTGPKQFNIDIRNIAKSLGYKLSDNSLVNEKTGKHIKCSSEEDIFKIMNLPYIRPEDRTFL